MNYFHTDVQPESSPRISIALCSFNGGRFIAEQLASIASQTLPPSEVVVCDDGSTDDTISCVESFAQSAPFPVRVERHASPLGIAANFSRAIELCSGDVIALSDQDDVWEPSKLEHIAAAFVANGRLGLVLSDATAIDSAGKDLHYRLWDAIVPPFTRAERRLARHGRLFDVLLRHYVATGATLAFAARYRDLILPIPGFALHDSWIATLIAAVAHSVIIDEPLVRYRQHASQAQGERVDSMLEQLRTARRIGVSKLEITSRRFQAMRNRLEGSPRFSPSDKILDELSQKVDHLNVRASMIRSGAFRLPIVLREIMRGRYRRYSHPWKWPLADLFL